jgi:hypothetical protein
MENVMTEKNYTTAFVVGQSPSEAFDAIVNVRGWWSEEIEGITDRAGRAVEDPDGHILELVWMDMGAMANAQGEHA